MIPSTCEDMLGSGMAFIVGLFAVRRCFARSVGGAYGSACEAMNRVCHGSYSMLGMSEMLLGLQVQAL